MSQRSQTTGAPCTIACVVCRPGSPCTCCPCGAGKRLRRWLWPSAPSRFPSQACPSSDTRVGRKPSHNMKKSVMQHSTNQQTAENQNQPKTDITTEETAKNQNQSKPPRIQQNKLQKTKIKTKTKHKKLPENTKRNKEHHPENCRARAGGCGS